MKKRRLLAVDDDETNLRILREILEDEFELREARTGEDALEKFAEFSPEAILLDVKMPGMGGYEVCQRIRSMPRGRGVKILMVSAQGYLIDRMLGYEAGADDYVTKPFEGAELLAKIQVYLDLQRAEIIDGLQRSALDWVSRRLQHPLRCIEMSAEILRDEPRIGTDQRRRFGEVIHVKAKVLQDFFEKVCLIDAIERGHWEPRHEKISLASVVNDVALELLLKSFERDIGIDVGVRREAEVEADRESLRTVLRGIVDNAIGFSAEGAKVEVEVDGREDAGIVRVSNVGEGIPPEGVERIFEVFSDPSPGVFKTGNQLSLALSAAIVERHGGRLHVDSVPGGRTTFVVDLPLLVGGECSSAETFVPNVYRG